MKKRIVSGVLIVLAGVLVAAYPWIKAAYFEYNKNQVLAQWEQMVASEGTTKTREAAPLSKTELESNFSEEVWEEDTDAPFDGAYVLENMEGILIIDKINLRYPILRGATKSNLDLTICAVMGSPEIGKEGNYSLAGHKSRIYGRQFNRLMELKKGDIVSLSDGLNSYDYAVAQTMQVRPADTWVLDGVKEEKALTLITCDYSVTPVGRYVVKCEPVE